MAKKKSGAARKSGSTSGDAAGPADIPASARLHVWQVQAVRDVLFVAAVVAIVWVGYMMSAVTVPLLVALLLAYLFEPVIDRMCKHPKMNRVRSVSALMATAGVAIAIVLAIVIPLIVTQSLQLIDWVAEGGLRRNSTTFVQQMVPETFRDEMMTIVELLPEGPQATAAGQAEGATDDAAEPEPAPPRGAADLSSDDLAAFIDDRIAAAIAAQAAAEPDAWAWIEQAKQYTVLIFGWLGAIVQAGLIAFLIPFYFFFFSLWYPSVVRFGRGLIPEKNKRRAIELLEKMDRVVSGFVRGRIVISLIMGLLLAIGWMICGVNFAIVIGFITGIFCAVPYLGVIGLPVAVALLFLETAAEPDKSDLWWFWALLWPTVVFVIVQLIEGYVLTPMIAGKVTNLDPVTIIVAVLAGGSVLGVYGMILAIPLAACGKILFMEVLLPRIHEWTEGRVSDPLPIDRN